MKRSKIAPLPALVLAAITVISLQMFLYDAEITMAEASMGSVPVQLVAQILITIATHLFVVLMVPMLLIAYRKYLAGYAVLALSLAAYAQMTTGLGLIGPMIAVIAVSILGIHGFRKASEWVRYRRTK
ncbi:hypothetical protein FGA82_25300 [Pseudomonas fluorescens]|uniref:hypothetical protein n=1 Tax=Pseudomonas fluorescens TaxID=294 RepID=UPI00113000CA|nr:hypothetical protein [Pseudomonas fluorescens]TMU71826.1 hypothetical protein FGA82_25300 [Pseudomonas fluorescens]